MRVFSRTIQRKVLALVVALGVLPGALAVGYLYYAGQLAINDTVGNLLQDNALALSTRLDARLTQCEETHARVSAWLESGQSAESWQRQTTESLAPKTIVVLDEIRNLVESSGEGVAAQALVARVLGRELPTAKRSYLDEFEVREGEIVVMLVSEFDRDGDPGYVVTAFLVSELLRGVIEDVQSGDAQLDVYSNRGYLLRGGRGNSSTLQYTIMRYTSLRSQFSGWEQPPAVSGQSNILGFASSRWLRTRQNEARTSVEWIVLAKLGTSDILVIIRDLLWRGLFFALLLVPALLAVSLIVARLVIQPVKLLRSQAEKIARGDLTARTNVRTSDELEDLSQAFNNMAEQLSANRRALEEQFLAAESRALQLELAAQISRTIFAAPSSAVLIEKFAVGLRDILAFDGLAVVAFTGEDSATVNSFGENPLAPAHESPNVARAYCEERLLGSLKPCHYLSEAELASRADIFSHHFRRVLFVPLLVERGFAGVVVVGRREARPWEQESVDSTVRIVQVLALALEHLVLYERLQSFAHVLEDRIRERTAELERTHTHLIQTERFAATGRLAANVAHEINNPLGIVKNYLQILRGDTAEDFRARQETLDVVNEELDRIARIVRSLMESYRPASLGRAEVSMNDVIRSLLPLIEASLKGHGISLCIDLDEDAPHVLMPPDHPRQILLNLIRNAEDAVSSGGRIHIRTRGETTETGDVLMLQVEDDGCGIHHQDRSRIFEPFFTTKKEGQGSGLGLSVTLGLVRSLRGTIEVESQPGGGATFTVRIPCGQSALAGTPTPNDTKF